MAIEGSSSDPRFHCIALHSIPPVQRYLFSAPWTPGRGIRITRGSGRGGSVARACPTGPSSEQLLLELRHPREHLAGRDRVIARLEAAHRDSPARRDAAEAAGERPAAPSSGGEPEPDPETPGRKAGDAHGRHGHRPVPAPDAVDEADGAGDRPAGPYPTAIPRTPLGRKGNSHCGHCRCGGRGPRGRPDLQTGDATGAARGRLGPDARAAIGHPNGHAGLSHGATAAGFGPAFGIGLTRRAGARVVRRAGRGRMPAYHEIEGRPRDPRHPTPDETDWRVGRHPVRLHGWGGGGGGDALRHRPATRPRSPGRGDRAGRVGHPDARRLPDLPPVRGRRASAVRRPRVAAGAEPVGDATGDGEAVPAAGRRPARGGPGDPHVPEPVARRDPTGRPRQAAGTEASATPPHVHDSSGSAFWSDPQVRATDRRAGPARRVPSANRTAGGGNRTEAGADAREGTSSVLATCHNRHLPPFAFVSRAPRGLLGTLFGSEGR